MKKQKNTQTRAIRLIQGILAHTGSIFLIVFIAIVLALSIRGKSGNPTIEELNSLAWKDEGPLELSPERGRYALLYSIVEDGSVRFSLPTAKFATPDLGYAQDQFVSLFAPGISFLIVPGYLIGKAFNISQVGTYAVIALISLINAVLIHKISRLLHFHPAASIASALVFLFGSPAFAYAVSLYQHHVSTLLILFSIYALLRWKNWFGLLITWFLCAASIPIDYPNAFLMAPIGILALTRMIKLESQERQYLITVKPLLFLTCLAIVIPFLFFTQFNTASYNNPFQFSGTVLQIQSFDAQDNPLRFDGTKIRDPLPADKVNQYTSEKRSAVAFFQTRNLLNGLHTHFTSIDRGVWFYTPIMLLAVVGLFLYYKVNPKLTQVLAAIVGVNILLYSMWGDPYGGWAFGSRYLIPSYAIMSIFLAHLLTVKRRNVIVIVVFCVLSIYSVAVGTLGALTTNRVPPKIEVLSLEAKSNRREKYTYSRNYEMIESNQSKSFAFQSYFSHKVTAKQYYLILVSLISITICASLIMLIATEPENQPSRNI